MNLQEVRKLFRDISGRNDLVNDDLSDNGANVFIQEGSKWLDRKTSIGNSIGSYKEIKAIDSWNVQFPHCRAVKEVWLATDEARWQLEKRSLQDILAAYYAKPPAEITSGTPLYYSPIYTRHIPEDISAATLATFETYVGVITPTDYGYNAIILSVPVDRSTLVEVKGLFYSMMLEDDSDENYWSVTNPILLAEASIMQVYKASGNRSLMKSLEENVRETAVDLDMDFVEEVLAESDQMEG